MLFLPTKFKEKPVRPVPLSSPGFTSGLFILYWVKNALHCIGWKITIKGWKWSYFGNLQA